MKEYLPTKCAKCERDLDRFCMIKSIVYCVECANEEIDNEKISQLNTCCDECYSQDPDETVKVINDLGLSFYLSSAIQKIVEGEELSADKKVNSLQEAIRFIELEMSDSDV